MATSHSKEAGRLGPVDNMFTILYKDCLTGFGELAMAHYFFVVQRDRVLTRCGREAMIDRNMKMPIAGSCDVSILLRCSAHHPSWSMPGADSALMGRGLSGAAPGPFGKPSFSSSFIAYDILSSQPGPPLWS
jgi:hypothetical protein